MKNINRKTLEPILDDVYIPLTSQLNLQVWPELLKDYWYQQLLQFLRFGIDLDFNRTCYFYNAKNNQTSATHFPNDLATFIEEGCKFGALLDLFK